MSTTLVRVQHRGSITIPPNLRTEAGISEGDMMEVSLHKGKIILVPKAAIDRSSFPTADEDYTPAQRRAIDARLAEAEDDIKHGRVHGPFATHEAMMTFLKGATGKPRKTAARKRNRTKK